MTNTPRPSDPDALRGYTLRDWRLLIAVRRSYLNHGVGSFAQAAARIEEGTYRVLTDADLAAHPRPKTITKGYLSKRLAALSAQLSCELRTPINLTSVKDFGSDSRVAALCALGNGLFDRLGDLSDPDHADRINIACSVGVQTYLLPRVFSLPADGDGLHSSLFGSGNGPPRTIMDELRGRRVTIGMTAYSGDTINGQFRERSVDLAITWTGHRGQPADAVAEHYPVRGARTDLHLLFHPTSGFATKFRRQGVTRLEADIRMLAGEQLVLCSMHQMEQFANFVLPVCDVRDTRVLRVNSFADVVHAVMMRLGVGIFIGWDWLLDDLRRDYHLYAARLTGVKTGPVADMLALDLSAYIRNDYHASTRPNVEYLIHQVENYFSRQADVAARRWFMVEPGSRRTGGFAPGYVGRFWYISPGGDHLISKPVWKNGTLAFDGPSSGTLVVTNRSPEKPTSSFTFEYSVRNGFHVFLFGRVDEPGRGQASVAYFSQQIARQGEADEQPTYMGSLNFVTLNEAAVTSLAVLSTEELTPEDLVCIERTSAQRPQFITHVFD